jgi:Immunity protein Imm1
MSKTQLKREPGFDLDHPEWSDIRTMMQSILVDEDEQALTLQFETEARVSELVIIRVNDAGTGEAFGWLVHYIPASRRESQILMTDDGPGTHVSLEFFGSLADVPETALVPEELIQSAAIYFLEHGDMNPSLRWSNYLATIRSN